MRLAGIEAGGTKFVCCIADEKGKIEDLLKQQLRMKLYQK